VFLTAEFEAAAAAVESLPETYGRRAQEERRTAEARADDRFTTGPIEQTMEDLRELPIFRDAVTISSDLARRTRDAVYDMSTAMSQEINETFTGQKTVTVSGETQRFFSKEAVAGMSEEARQRLGANESGEIEEENTATFYKDEGSDLFGSTEAADLIQKRIRSNEDFDPMTAYQDYGERSRSNVELGPDQIERLESKSDQINNLGEFGTPIRGGTGRSYTYEELAEAGVTTVEGSGNDTYLQETDLVYTLTPEEAEKRLDGSETGARIMKEMFEAPSRSYTELSDKAEEGEMSARDVYAGVREAMSGISQERRNKILNTAGGDGSKEVRALQRDVLQRGLNLDSDLEGEALDKAAAEKLSNIEGGMSGMRKGFTDVAGGQLLSMIRRFGPETANFKETSPSEQEAILDRSTMVNQNLRAMGEVGTFTDTDEAERLQDYKPELMAMASAKALGGDSLEEMEDSLSDEQLRTFVKARNTISRQAGNAQYEAERLTDRMSEQLTNKEMRKQLEVAQSDLAGTGSDEQASSNGLEQNVSSTDKEARDMIKDKMIQLARVIEELQDNQKEIIDLADPGSGSKGGTGGGTGRGSAGGTLGLGLFDN
jgi:hypothetical protein